MINRIRDIRLQKGLTLAEVAAACRPPTTAQTIGRLEMGTRNLSLVWMNRIAAALRVEPEVLLRSEAGETPRIVAVLGEHGAQAARAVMEPILPSDLQAGAAWLVLAVEAASGDYRAGDQVWLRRHSPQDAPLLVNRDVLAPAPGDRFAFGRLAARAGGGVTLLPPAIGQPEMRVDNPAWLAVAEMLVRRL